MDYHQIQNILANYSSSFSLDSLFVDQDQIYFKQVVAININLGPSFNFKQVIDITIMENPKIKGFNKFTIQTYY